MATTRTKPRNTRNKKPADKTPEALRGLAKHVRRVILTNIGTTSELSIVADALDAMAAAHESEVRS